MHFDILKQDGKLIIQNLRCDCACDHNMPDMDIYIRSGLIETCATCLKTSGLDGGVVIVADSVTYHVAAQRVEQRLKEAGFGVKMCVLPGEKIEPTPQMADIICAMVDDDTDFLLSVGSGVITDLTRRSAFLKEKPFAVFGTAASMDGYTSITSSMMIENLKISKYGNAARLLMFDPAVLATAPLLMQASGVGDMLAKYNVLVDWKLGHAVTGEVFCPLCEEMLLLALKKCTDNIDEIHSRSEKGMEALIESLILAGLTVLIVRNTRPVASVEHNMAHYWDMMHVANGGPQPPSHGLCVGIALVYALLYHNMLKDADLSLIDKEKIKAQRMTKAQKQAYIQSCYPPGAGEEAMQNNKDWYIDWEEQERRIDALVAYHDEYKKSCEILPDYRDVMAYLSRFGAPTSAAQAQISRDRLKNALLCAKDHRTRYSIAKALSELGMIEDGARQLLDRESRL